MSTEKKNPGGHRGSSLSNGCREFLLQRGLGFLALSLDALYHAGVVPGSQHSQQKLVEIAMRAGYSVDALYRALKMGVFYKTAQTGTGGRNGTLVYVPTPQQVYMWYGLPIDGRSDELPTWAYTSVKSYRKAVHFALIARYTRQKSGHVAKSIEWFANRLGVSRRTVQRYNAELKSAGIIDYQPDHTVSPVPAGAAFYSFPSVRTFKVWMQGVSPAGKAFTFPGIRELAAKLQRDGWQLTKIRQHCNMYWAL